MHTLRSYQSDGIKKIFDAWRSGHRAVLYQQVTGTGKTVLFSHITKYGHDRDRCILICVHRRELIDQAVSHLQKHGIDAGIILSGKRTDYSKKVQVASIQTLCRREGPEANLIVIDECHHAKAKSYLELWGRYPDSKILGVTATPIRLDGKGFVDVFDVLIPSWQPKAFIDAGFLCPIKQMVGAIPDVSKVKKRQGDYVSSALSRVMLDNSVMVELVKSYRKHADGKPMIVFAVNVDHSREIVSRYQQAGYTAAHVDAKTPKYTRSDILERFKAGDIQIISNVEIITEGFDSPTVEVIQLARPTKSLALYLQMVGRGMRPAPGKAFGLVLDNAGLWLEHGLAVIDRYWSLGDEDTTPIRKEPKLMIFDDDGVVRDVSQLPPEELEGLELVELTEEFERLLKFEYYAQQAQSRHNKLISAYYRYIEYLQYHDIILTTNEFEYIKKRMNAMNGTIDRSLRFNPKFWQVQKKNYQNKQYADTLLSFNKRPAAA